MMTEVSAHTPSVAIVLLAAGKASRMGEGGPHKLLATFNGVPLVRRMALTARAAAALVIVVTGHRRIEVEAALEGLDIETVWNGRYESGMASSIAAGLGSRAVAGADGVMIMLSDMPGLTADALGLLIAAFDGSQGKAIVRAVFDGARGNPVILPSSLRPALLALEGDVGARSIIERCGLPIIEVEIGAAAQLDVDTPEAVIAAGGILRD
jgi:molybdenum cofactor cytidylyltransferase